MIKTWKNGASGKEVRNVIEYNFNLISKYLAKDIKALSTQERKSLPSDYISDNTLVFDTDEMQWYKYSKGSWIETSVENNEYVQIIFVNDWIDNNISILFSEHAIKNPAVQLFMRDGDSFIPVLGGVKIDSEYNIILSTDLPFDGKVVIG